MTHPLLALPLLAALLSPTPAGAAASAASWQAPVTPVVVERAFEPPSGPYSRGHRGVDLAAEPGALVRAPAVGVVRFASRVAGEAVMSIEHPHRILGRTGWRTTYSGVRAQVDTGDSVRAGDVIGVVVVQTHAPGIHWGLKNARAYADPLLLLRRPVVLKPLADYARGCACS